VFLLAHDDDAAAEALLERLRTAAPTRRLGRANALVARSLLAPDVAPEGEAAAAVELQATGWVVWVDRCLPGEGSLLRPPRPWLEALSAGLTERAADAAQSARCRNSRSSRSARALALGCAAMRT
jgi:hypothetical protein